MIQPFGLAVCLGLFLGKQGAWREGDLKRRCRAFCLIPAVLFAVFLLAALGDGLAYRGETWREYQRFNRVRAELYDIYGKPAYEEVRDILDRFQVTEAQYQAFCNGTILDWEISVECGEELVAYAREHGEVHPSLWEVLRMTWQDYFGDGYWQVNHLAVSLWAVLLLWVLLRRRFVMLLPILGVAAARTAVWGYLIWQGRYPHRVTHPLFLCEIALALALLWIECDKVGLWRQRALLLVCCAAVCVTAYQSGKRQYYYTAEQNRGKLAFMEGMYEIQEYCRCRPENRYLMESVSAGYYTGSALDARLAQPRNSVVSGCWYSNSPSMRAKLAEYLEGAEELYLILYRDGNESSHPSVKFLEEACGSRAQAADEITASHGGTYTVYRFEIRR